MKNDGKGTARRPFFNRSRLSRNEKKIGRTNDLNHCTMVLKNLIKARKGHADALSDDTQLAATGLLVRFGLQAAINMASSLHLIPTKGMTLPFLSYGGSSMLALGLCRGMMLALTRRRLAGSFL